MDGRVGGGSAADHGKKTLGTQPSLLSWTMTSNLASKMEAVADAECQDDHAMRDIMAEHDGHHDGQNDLKKNQLLFNSLHSYQICDRYMRDWV